jgi:hypothetical protein
MSKFQFFQIYRLFYTSKCCIILFVQISRLYFLKCQNAIFVLKRAFKRRRTERDRQNVECPSLVERQCRPSMSGPGLSSSGSKVKSPFYVEYNV